MEYNISDRVEVVEGGSFVNEQEETIILRQYVFTNTTFWHLTLAAYKLLQMVALLSLFILTQYYVRNKRFSTGTLKAAIYLHLLLAFVFIPVYAILWYTNAPIHVDFVVLCLIYSVNVHSFCLSSSHFHQVYISFP